MSEEKTQARERPAGSIQVPTRGDTGEGYGQASPVAARIAHLEGLLHAADAALEALGVPNHGEPIAERIAKAGHLQSALFRKLREHQEAHAETLGEIAKALDDAGDGADNRRGA